MGCLSERETSVAQNDYTLYVDHITESKTSLGKYISTRCACEEIR